MLSAWENTEWLLQQELTPKFNLKRLRSKSRLIILSFFLIGVINQALERIAGYNRTTDCFGFTDRMHAYFNQSFPELFTFFIYSRPIAFFALVISVICDFLRNFLDIFLLTICSAIREQFEILNKRILTTPVSVSLNSV